jgi:hypothetical protein
MIYSFQETKIKFNTLEKVSKDLLKIYAMKIVFVSRKMGIHVQIYNEKSNAIDIHAIILKFVIKKIFFAGI